MLGHGINRIMTGHEQILSSEKRQVKYNGTQNTEEIISAKRNNSRIEYTIIYLIVDYGLIHQNHEYADVKLELNLRLKVGDWACDI